MGKSQCHKKPKSNWNVNGFGRSNLLSGCPVDCCLISICSATKAQLNRLLDRKNSIQFCFGHGGCLQNRCDVNLLTINMVLKFIQRLNIFFKVRQKTWIFNEGNNANDWDLNKLGSPGITKFSYHEAQKNHFADSIPEIFTKFLQYNSTNSKQNWAFIKLSLRVELCNASSVF